MKKRSVTLSGHRTSLSLEDIFWDELKVIAKKKNTSVKRLIESVDAQREDNLSSCLRVLVVTSLKEEIFTQKILQEENE